MANSEKDSYKIAKILKKLTGILFLHSRQQVDISDEGREKLNSQEQQQASTRKNIDIAKANARKNTQFTDAYVHYQKELEAAKLMGAKEKPIPPGKILKLPTGRKEIMSKSEE